MSDNHGRAREQDALEWLTGFDPDDGHGLVGAQALDAASMFTQPVVLAAFEAGASHAEAEFAIERAVGQRQLDGATVLIREAADLFVGYSGQHKAAAEGHESGGNLESARGALLNAQVCISMAVSLKEWLQGEEGEEGAPVAHVEFRRDQPGLACEVACPVGPVVIPAEIAANGDLVPVDSGKTSEDCRARFGSILRRTLGSNVRPVKGMPLEDVRVVEGLMAASGMIDATSPLSVMQATAFRLQTADPRFDPHQPVCVNGYLYTPTTEA